MIHGILNVYKEKGYTSHDVVAKLRGITHQKKIGHTGTLDPDATGVLPVCFGKATKLCDLLTDKDKTYETVLLLGKETDTQDISGEVLEEKDTKSVTEAAAAEAAYSFEGEYMQVPPMYSALKVNGKKLYELAREGKTVERKARLVKIHKIEVMKIELPRVWMRVSCSKGTYIRTLCHDIGQKLGCGGCMEQLERTQVGRFCLESGLTLDEIAKRAENQCLEEVFIAIDEMFSEFPEVVVKKEWEAAARNGNSLSEKMVTSANVHADGQTIRLYDRDRHFIALYKWKDERKEYHLLKMFFNEI